MNAFRTIKNKLFVSTSLSSQGARLQFGVAIALISVLPLLTLYHLSQSFTPDESLTTGKMWGIGVMLSCVVCSGYALLLKYPRTVMRLRQHMESVARGEIPDNINLLDGESDISAIEKYFNLIIDRMRQRITTIERQGEQLVGAERQRVMTESLCTACHCLGQPATTIGCYLELLKTESLSPAGDEHLACCIAESGTMRDLLKELQSIAEYRTEEYCAIPGNQQSAGRLIRTRCDKATRPFS